VLENGAAFRSSSSGRNVPWMTTGAGVGARFWAGFWAGVSAALMKSSEVAFSGAGAEAVSSGLGCSCGRVEPTARRVGGVWMRVSCGRCCSAAGVCGQCALVGCGLMAARMMSGALVDGG